MPKEVLVDSKSFITIIGEGEPPPPPPPDFETLWPLLVHVIGSILVGTATISASSA